MRRRTSVLGRTLAGAPLSSDGTRTGVGKPTSCLSASYRSSLGQRPPGAAPTSPAGRGQLVARNDDAIVQWYLGRPGYLARPAPEA